MMNYISLLLIDFTTIGTLVVVLPLFNYKVQHFGEIIDVICARPPDMRPLVQCSVLLSGKICHFFHNLF